MESLRFGGDEFAVVVGDMLQPGEAVLLARRIRKSITQPITVMGQPTVITTSIGIAVAEGGEQPQDLLRDADTAMHRAKEKGRDVAVVFDDHLREQAIRRLEVENKLREALDADEVEHYIAHRLEQVAQSFALGARSAQRVKRINAVDLQ